MSRNLVALIAAVAGLSGCFNDSDCQYAATQAADNEARAPSIDLRNPDTGQCEAVGGGGDDYSCDACGNCLDVPAEPVPQPDWAQCYGSCEALAETDCLATAGCRAAYVGDNFYQCWATAPSGPVRGGDCSQLGSYECSRHDDCTVHHAAGAPGGFISCAPETPTNDAGSCVGEVLCDSLPPACPQGTIAGRRDGCWTGYCIPLADCDALPTCGDLDEPMCIGRDDCTPVYEGQNCTCTGTACTCQSWLFDTCEDA